MIKIIFLVVYGSLILGLLFRILKTHLGFNKTQKKLDDYHNFSMEVMEWVKEMSNSVKRNELMIYHLNHIGGSLEETLEKANHIEEYRKYIEDTWGEYIPSLKQKLRDKKIDTILNS